MTLRDHYVKHGTYARAAEDLDVTVKQYQRWITSKSKPGRWKIVSRLIKKEIEILSFPD